MILLFKITIAQTQVELTEANLEQVCKCTPFQSTFIYLSEKDITTIDSSTFNGLNSLQTLYLSRNKLTKIDQSTFNGLNSLQYIYLDNNKLTTIDSYTFKGLKSLHYLDLDFNELTKIDSSSFDGPNLLKQQLIQPHLKDSICSKD